MTSESDTVFVAECSKCGAKISQSGDSIGGNVSCDHKYGAIGGYDAEKKEVVILYPSEKELNWIRIIDKNKAENIDYYKKFQQDVNELSKLKSNAISEISSMCETLRTAVDKREEELKESIIKLFEIRQETIRLNMKQLNDHKNINQEAKKNSEDLLKSDKPAREREKMIIGICETVMNTIPDLRCIETELRCSFSSLQRIENNIKRFGEIHSKEIDSGEKCIFAYKKQLILKQVKLPMLQLKKSNYTKEEKVKLTFKVIQKKENNDIDIMQYLKIKILCLDDDDDDDEKKDMDDDLNKSIHQEIISFVDCQPKGSNYEIFINHKFNGGMTVIFKIQPIFESHDDKIWKSSEGEWSKEKTCEIPENKIKNVFNVQLENESRKLCVKDDDNILTNFEQFKSKFLKIFNRELQEKEYLILFIVDGDILNGRHNLMSFSNSTYSINGKIVNIPKKLPGLVDFKGVRKKINLKNKAKENIYEFTMEFVKNHLIGRYQTHNLSKHFDLKIRNGKHIQFMDTDYNEDIVKYFLDYKGVIEIIQKQNQ